MKNENPLSAGEVANWHAAALKALPHDLDPVYVRYWTRNTGQLHQRFSQNLLVSPRDLFHNSWKMHIKLTRDYVAVSELKEALEVAGCEFKSSPAMTHLLYNTCSRHLEATGQRSESLELVLPTMEELGFYHGAPVEYEEVYKQAQKLGLLLCPSIVGPELAMQYRGPKLDHLHTLDIMMKPIIYERPKCAAIFQLSRGVTNKRVGGLKVGWHPGGCNITGRAQWVFMMPPA